MCICVRACTSSRVRVRVGACARCACVHVCVDVALYHVTVCHCWYASSPYRLLSTAIVIWRCFAVTPTGPNNEPSQVQEQRECAGRPGCCSHVDLRRYTQPQGNVSSAEVPLSLHFGMIGSQTRLVSLSLSRVQASCAIRRVVMETALLQHADFLKFACGHVKEPQAG